MVGVRKKNIPNTLKSIPFLWVMLLLALVLVQPSQAEARRSKPIYAAFVMDADTGLILHQENASRHVYPASLTKMMTLLLTFDALEKGDLHLNDRVRFSRHAAGMAPSKLGLKPGASIRVRDAIHALVTKSANDVAAALGEKLGGTESNFALMMTKKAHELGMRNTQFRNASGLHNRHQHTTARDIARLSLVLIRDYPKYYSYFSTRSFTYNGRTYRNHNRLMESYEGMDGLKTGYIAASGFNLAASAVRNNHRLIGVVFGGRTAKWRNDRMKRLLDDGFAKINTLSIARIKNVPVPPLKPIYIAGKIYNQPVETAQNDIITEQSTPTEDDDDAQGATPRWALLDSTDENSVLNRMIGEGDYDIAARNRLETGIIAASAITGEQLPASFFEPRDYDAPEDTAPQTQTHYPPMPNGKWAIQVGAFSSREGSNTAISNTLKKLPAALRSPAPVVAPLHTKRGKWLYRARLSGYSEEAAHQACDLLPDCLPIAPHD